MANEAETSPLKMQMLHSVTSDMRGLRIFEHRGDSGTWYEEESDVNKGVLKILNRQVPENPDLVAIHKDETLSEYTKDNVAVELVRIEESSQELMDAQMRNDEY